MATGQPCSSPNATTSSGEVRGSERPGTPGHAGLLGGQAGADLVAHDLDGLGRRSDEGHAALGDGAGEVGVLGEEAVAGVDPVGPALLDGVEDGLGVEVALGRRLAAERVGLVGHADVQGVAVEVGVDGHRADAQLATRPDHPDGDLAAVCNQDLLEHAGLSSLRRTITIARTVWCLPCGAVSGTSTGSTRSTPPTRMCVTRPARGRPQGLVAVADHQTAGRGRLDRRWESPPGANLLASVLLRPGCDGRRRAPVRRGRGAGRGRCLPGGGRGRARAQVAQRPAGRRRQAGRGPGRGRIRRALPAAVVVGIGINVAWPGPPERRRHLPGRRRRHGAAGRPPGPPRAPAGRPGAPAALCSTRRPAGGVWPTRCAAAAPRSARTCG